MTPPSAPGWIEDNSYSTTTYEELFDLPADSPGGETYWAYDRAIARARREQEAMARRAVADEVDALVRRSGSSTAELARRLGTSRSRLSTFRTGRVTSSAAFLVRLRKVVERVTSAGPES